MDSGSDDVSDGTPPPGHQAAPPSPRGSMRYQDAASTTPRAPTVAEARQRDKARRARETAEEFAALQRETAAKRKATGKKVLMGSVAVVGVVGVVALGYQMLHEDTVSATCVADGSNEVVPDSYCSSGYSGAGGVFIFAGSPYRYYYGGSNGGIGTPARGGTLELPKGTTGKTSSGSTVSRGGFGSSSHGSSGS